MTGGGPPRPAEQLTFRLPYRPAYGRADFLVADANRAAVGWIDAWPDWPQPALVLVGPAASGKSHLAQVWRSRAGAVTTDAMALLRREPPRILGETAAACLIDDADWLFADLDHDDRLRLEHRLLHLHNMLRDRGGHLLLTGQTPPRRWELQLADLRSRLVSAPVAELGPPDDELIQAVLIKQFADRQLSVSPDVVRFLWPRMERSFDAARRLVDALDAASLARRKDITVPLARRVLAEQPELTSDATAEDKESNDGSGDRR